MSKRLLVGIITGTAITLATQKLVEVRRDRKNERELYPYGSFKHFSKLEQAGLDRSQSYGRGV
jgi:hypothetical protein